MSEKLDFIISSLDLHLMMGKTPGDAWTATVEDYANVWHVDDDRTHLARAAVVVLKRMEEDSGAVKRPQPNKAEGLVGVKDGSAP